MEAIIALWQRDVIKFFRDRARLLGSFAMPFMFLVIFGSGISGAISSMFNAPGMTTGLESFDYVSYMFPGIIAMTVFTTAIFSALSVVQDKEDGYMREILVSPVSRTQVAIGKILGGSTVASMQGLLMLVFVPFVGVELTVGILVRLIPAIFLVAFTLSSIGLLFASRLKSAEGFQAVVQVIVFPMLFLSGAFFPLNGMPEWMNVLVKVNPLTYGVDLFKKIVLDVGSMAPQLREAFGLNFAVMGHTVTVYDDILLIGALAVVFVLLATMFFRKGE
jgi:ABC-2 type transport system permease protein